MRIFALLLTVVVIACHKPADEQETVADSTVSNRSRKSSASVTQSSNQSAVFASEDAEDHFFSRDSTYTVIATSGTAFRQQPDSASLALIQLPYGTHVKVVERMQYDTLQEAHSKRKIPGVWVKMRYNNQEGFVFSSDVMSRNYYEQRHSVQFFLQGEHCVSNYEFSPDYHYYAVYKRDSVHSFLRKVQPVFYVRHEVPTDVDVWEWFHIQTNLSGEPLFIFGVPKELKEQEIATYAFAPYDYYSETDTPEPVQTSQYIIHIVRENKDNGWPIPEVALLDKKGVRIQKFVGSHILFCGDLDQDGVADLVYLDTNEKEGGYHLALSSYAIAGKLIEAVGYYQLGYCC